MGKISSMLLRSNFGVLEKNIQSLSFNHSTPLNSVHDVSLTTILFSDCKVCKVMQEIRIITGQAEESHGIRNQHLPYIYYIKSM